jgi:hypothetical protein
MTKATIFACLGALLAITATVAPAAAMTKAHHQAMDKMHRPHMMHHRMRHHMHMRHHRMM